MNNDNDTQGERLKSAGAACSRFYKWAVDECGFALNPFAGLKQIKVEQWLGNDVAVCVRHYASMMPTKDPDIDRLG